MALYGRLSSATGALFVPSTINDPQTAIDAEIHHVLYKCLAKITLWVWNKIKQMTPDEDQAVCCLIITVIYAKGLTHA
jgi:hypothetical protein